MHPKAPLLARHSIKYHQELVDRIIDDLRDSIPTLKLCSLVSKSWQPRAQKWLFEIVVFNAPPLYSDFPTTAMSGELPKRVQEVRRSNLHPRGAHKKTPARLIPVERVARAPRPSSFLPQPLDIPCGHHPVATLPLPLPLYPGRHKGDIWPLFPHRKKAQPR